MGGKDGKTTEGKETLYNGTSGPSVYVAIKPHCIKTWILLQNKLWVLAFDFLKYGARKFNVQYISKVLYNSIVFGSKISYPC